MPSKRTFMLIGSLLIVIVAGFLAGYALGPVGLGGHNPGPERKMGDPFPPGKGSGETFPQPLPGMIDANGLYPAEDWASYKPKAGAPVLRRIFYTRCGHSEEDQDLVSNDMAKKTLRELALDYPEHRIYPGPGDGLTIEKVVNDFCPDDRTFRHIGLKDGYVAVFYGRPKENAVLKSMTDIAAKDLYPADRKRLEAGIVAVGDADLERILEGLTD
ncbi:MAG TPA: hypothetical protein GX507_02165 [Clostridia bacterium]|nr:hypothetical protein [Clostridia bacterium]